MIRAYSVNVLQFYNPYIMWYAAAHWDTWAGLREEIMYEINCNKDGEVYKCFKNSLRSTTFHFTMSHLKKPPTQTDPSPLYLFISIR